jgi:hypothetical protein
VESFQKLITMAVGKKVFFALQRIWFQCCTTHKLEETYLVYWLAIFQCDNFLSLED